MDKIWSRIVILAIVTILVIIGWDLYLTFSGAKNTKEFTVTEISPLLYGKLETHLRTDAKFSQFEAAASSQTNQ